MSKLYFLEYGCSVSTEHLIVSISDTDPESKLDTYGRESAIEVYYSYDCNYPSEEEYEDMTEEEISEQEYQDMLNDISWTVEIYDEENEEHLDAFKEQNNKPFEI